MVQPRCSVFWMGFTGFSSGRAIETPHSDTSPRGLLRHEPLNVDRRVIAWLMIKFGKGSIIADCTGSPMIMAALVFLQTPQPH